SWSIRDLCRVRARSQNEPFLAQEMEDLPELSGEGSLEAQWAMLTPKSQVWVDGTNAQLFYRGDLYPTVAKEIYTTPSEALLDNVAKNLVMQHHHFSMGLIDKVRDFERVVDELSQIIDELQGEVRKLNEEAGLIMLAIAEARASKATQRLEESQHQETKARGQIQKAESAHTVEQGATPERAQTTIAQYKETSGFKLGLEKMGWVSNKYGFRVALPRFWVRYSQLEIKEDPYANLPEDDNVSMEAEVPFDDNDPPTHKSPSEESLASLPRFFCNWPS
ncbi:hypothetical protein GW17_00023466, partial [Ensete ventricosum]